MAAKLPFFKWLIPAIRDGIGVEKMLENETAVANILRMEWNGDRGKTTYGE